MLQRELDAAVGVGMHYALNALIAKDFVKLGSVTAAEGTGQYAYILDLPSRFRAIQKESLFS